MSVQGQIDRISSNIASVYRIAQREGITLPENKNSDNLSTLINSVINENAPDYIVAEAERVAANVQSTQATDSLVFPIMSDFHIYDGDSSSNHLATFTSMRYASMGIAELKKHIDFDFVCHLGDYSWMSASDYTTEQVIKDITAVRDTFDSHDTEIWCVGNHDLNYGKGRDRLLTLDELYNYIGANSDGIKPTENANRCYGYLDFEQQKIRVIYLNTCDISDLVVPEIGTENASSEWVSPTQIQWLADTALNFSDKEKASDWGIVIVGHHPLHYPIGCFKNVMTILEAYKDGLSGSLSCTIRVETADDGTKTYPQQKVAYDFSATERAEFICNIHGHAHNYASSKISSTTNAGSTEVTPWLWRFCIPQICSSRNNTGYENFKTNEIAAQNYGEFEADGVTPKYWDKETGNAKATSFCVVDINRTEKKIFAYYFGVGKDREFNYDAEYVAQEFAITISVNNCSSNSDNPTTITEGETATLSFTANEGYELPDSITVTGASYTWDKSGTLILTDATSDVGITIDAVVYVAPSYTNQIPISTDTDGSIYNSIGYKIDTRLNSSGIAESNTSSSTGKVTTGFIPVPETSSYDLGQVVLYFQNITLDNTTGTRIAFYDENKTYVGTKYGSQVVTESTGVNDVIVTWDANSHMTIADASKLLYYYKISDEYSVVIKYIRVNGTGVSEDPIITINEPINETETITSYAITSNLSNVTNSNEISTIAEGETYTATLTANSGYTMDGATVTITMGDADVTDTVYTDGVISITNVMGDIVITASAVKTSSYTNLLPLATTAPDDDTIYGEDYDGDGVNDGYKKNTRFSSSSGIQTKAGYQLTGLILATNDDIVRIKNIGGEITTANKNLEFYIFVKNDGTLSAQQPANNYATGYEQPDANGVYTFKAPLSANACCGIRFSGKGITGDTIITVNEEISM